MLFCSCCLFFLTLEMMVAIDLHFMNTFNEHFYHRGTGSLAALSVVTEKGHCHQTFLDLF